MHKNTVAKKDLSTCYGMLIIMNVLESTLVYEIKCVISSPQRIHVKYTHIWYLNNLFQNTKRAILWTLIKLLKVFFL